jgi:hypothetical protein
MIRDVKFLNPIQGGKLMKKMILVLLMLFVAVGMVFCADAGANTQTAAAIGPKLLYPDFGFFSGMRVRITGDDKIYRPNDPDIERLLSSTAMAKEYLDGYYFKYQEHSIVAYSCLVLLAGDMWYFIDQMNNHRTLALPDTVNYHLENSTIILSVSVGIIAVTGIFYGFWLEDEACNDFCKSINEYNLTISGGPGGAEIRKNIKF